MIVEAGGFIGVTLIQKEELNMLKCRMTTRDQRFVPLSVLYWQVV